MPSHAELYDYYCRRSSCHPNSSVTKSLEDMKVGAPLLVVDVSGNYLGQRGLIPVLDLVKNVKTVRMLDVSNNEMGTEQVQHLAYCLALHPSIQILRLRNTGLHDGHADVLQQLVSMNNSLERIDVEGNQLSPSVTAALEDALRRNAETQRTQRVEDLAHAAHLTTKAAKVATLRRSFTATFSGTIAAAESGGYVHYATWWRNPQLSVKTSRSSRVSFVLECTAQQAAGMSSSGGHAVASEGGAAATLAANQMGLMVLRHDGVHRAVQITETTVVAESAVSDNRCVVHAFLDVAESYVVMPFTFNPGRALPFTVTATLINDSTFQEEGWVTIEPLDPRYDWCTHSVDGVWTDENAGGGGHCTTWRRNNMYHLTNNTGRDTGKTGGSPTALKSAALATMYVLLVKQTDPYDVDERAIGVDVVRADSRNATAPPLFYSSDIVCASVQHARTSFVLLKLTLPASEVNVYVVPSTECAGQTGTYSLTVFSSVAVTLSPTAFPHGWRYRVLDGVWDETCCGGCRAECSSWKSNPSVEVRAEDPTQPLIACVTLRSADIQTPQHGGEDEKDATEESMVSPEAAQRAAELAAFRQRHRSTKLEVGVMAVDAVAPSFPLLATSNQSEHAASIVVSPVPPVFYIVSMLRHAAEVAAYTLELFSPAAFILESPAPTCLAVRERQAQLAAYTKESKQRASLLQAAAGEAGQRSEAASTDSEELQAVRAAIAERCAATGLPFIDRDFPRGTSSLFLDPAGPPPMDFPAETTWWRASELASAVPPGASPQQLTCRVDPTQMAPPYPYGPRHWFASVLQAIAAKPGWLSRIFVLYNREAGFAQFRFFKQESWVGVTIDDYLLTDNQIDLLYGHSNSRSEARTNLFFPLAEKAYAKLHRCYEALEPKVDATQTTQDRLLQGLADVTGGFTTVLRIRSLEKAAVEMPQDERDSLWRRLKRAIEPTRLCSLLLDGPDAAVTRERAYVGVLPGRLYGVVDARFVEQQRLVKIRLFGSDDEAEGGWRGKWALHSPRWTPTLRDVLDYHVGEAAEMEPNVAWVHFDEVLYYFTHVLVTEVCPVRVSVAGSFAEPFTHDPATAAATLRNPQFALDVAASEATTADTRVEVHVGLHRRDPRLDITRRKDATAQLKTAVGFAVFATEDNTRRLLHVAEDKELLQLIKPTVARDVYVTLQLDADYLSAPATKHITVMPFRDGLRDPDVSYTLSASTAAGATVALTHVAPISSTTVCGRWGATKAGPPDFPQWRNNPQFFLSAAETTEVTVTLRPATTTTATLGFTLHRTRHCSSFLGFDPASVVASAACDVAGGAPSCVVRLAGMSERRGMPYVLVPYSSHDTEEFQLEVAGNRPVQLRPIDPRLDWHRAQTTVSITAAKGNTGGNLTYPSWRFNTQLILTLPVERDGRLFISARRLRSADPRVKIGMALLHAGAAVAGGYRRRLTYAAADIIATSTDSAAESVVDTVVSLPRDSGALLLIVFADQPYKEAEVELSIYAAPTIEVQPVQEWAKVVVQEGSWNLGTTAAGSRTNFASWINNPFFGLSVLRPTKVSLLLVQYPRDHEHPVVRRHGDRKALLPPPLVHPDRCTAIQLSVAKYDAALTEVVSTAPTMNAETHVTAELTPEQSYFVVPCTTEPQHDGDFKLFAFADHHIDFYETEKPRLPYM